MINYFQLPLTSAEEKPIYSFNFKESKFSGTYDLPKKLNNHSGIIWNRKYENHITDSSKFLIFDLRSIQNKI